MMNSASEIKNTIKKLSLENIILKDLLRELMLVVLTNNVVVPLELKEQINNILIDEINLMRYYES